MENITPLQFWLGVLTVLAPQIFQIISNYQQHRANRSVTQSQADVGVSEAWEKLAQEYARQIESLRRLEVENAELRPLMLKLALQEQDMKQVREDKEDWKRYASKLSKQIEGLGHVPIPFRRVPTDEDTNEKIKPIRRNNKPTAPLDPSTVPAATDTPTIINGDEEKNGN